uniref:Candidate secreted effector n=1 Tax=Meloidogyne incognita TaxID=6306 RepID=A0A914NVP1_MELIC
MLRMHKPPTITSNWNCTQINRSKSIPNFFKFFLTKTSISSIEKFVFRSFN